MLAIRWCACISRPLTVWLGSRLQVTAGDVATAVERCLSCNPQCTTVFDSESAFRTGCTGPSAAECKNHFYITLTILISSHTSANTATAVMRHVVCITLLADSCFGCFLCFDWRTFGIIVSTLGLQAAFVPASGTETGAPMCVRRPTTRMLNLGLICLTWANFDHFSKDVSALYHPTVHTPCECGVYVSWILIGA